MEENHITRLNINDKEIILLGTAHVSASSVDEVKQTIEREQPDTVCIELDQGRFQSIMEKEKWANTDIVKIIRKGKSGMLFANILLANYQRKLANQFNINPGQEMIQGIASAKDVHAELILADRDIQITFSRIWKFASFFEKLKLMVSITMSILDDEKISEEELENLKSRDMLNAALSEMSKEFKSIKKYLLDERDQYLAAKIKAAPGKKIVAVLGAAHVSGITQLMEKDYDIKALEFVPPRSKISKVIGWTIPIALVALVVATFMINPMSGIEQTKNWLIWTMSLSGLGCLLAGGHIFSILTAIITSPIAALSPVLATGWFSGIMEARVRKPKVEDFETLPVDLSHFSGLWKNKITRILMVVVLTNIGCSIGNIAGSINVISIFIQTFS